MFTCCGFIGFDRYYIIAVSPSTCRFRIRVCVCTFGTAWIANHC